MNKDYWIKWIKAAGIRAARTFAQTAISVLGCSTAVEVAQTKVITLATASWGLAFSAGAFAAVFSLLMSVRGLPEVEKEIITMYDDGPASSDELTAEILEDSPVIEAEPQDLSASSAAYMAASIFPEEAASIEERTQLEEDEPDEMLEKDDER